MKLFLYKTLALIIAALFCGGSYGEIPKNAHIVQDQAKNVILLIGDGMGFNTIKKTEDDRDIHLDSFDRFTMSGESKTKALGGITTDSAAGSTAIACGVKTSKGCVGVYPTDFDAKNSRPMNLTDIALEKGMATGIITTNDTTDATPADFSAHVGYREQHKEIFKQQCKSGIDFIWGQKAPYLDKKFANDNGIDIISDINELDEIQPGTKTRIELYKKHLYNFEWEQDDSIIVSMENKALRLLEQDEDGFFFVVEVDHIDGGAEKNDAEKMEKAMMTFNQCINIALDYAQEHEDTMVVVTADHETGGIKKIGGKYRFTTTRHTSANVPVYVYGCDDFMKNGEVFENTETGRRIANAMGETNFPRRIAVQ